MVCLEFAVDQIVFLIILFKMVSMPLRQANVGFCPIGWEIECISDILSRMEPKG